MLATKSQSQIYKEETIGIRKKTEDIKQSNTRKQKQEQTKLVIVIDAQSIKPSARHLMWDPKYTTVYVAWKIANDTLASHYSSTVHLSLSW